MIRPDQLATFTDSVGLACGISPDEANSEIRAELGRVSEILWSYFLLSDASKPDFRSAIYTLWGAQDESPGDSEDILDELQIIFESAAKDSTASDDVEVSRHLSSLLDEYFEGSANSGAEFDSLAEFAEPLICCSKVLANPDLIDEMMMRAHDYWNLALGGRQELDNRLTSIINKYTQNGDSPADIRSEAHMMLERFELLYRSNDTRQ